MSGGVPLKRALLYGKDHEREKTTGEEAVRYERVKDYDPVLKSNSYDKFIASHSKFVLAAKPRDYLPWHLARIGCRVVPTGFSVPPLLYDVSCPQADDDENANKQKARGT